MRKKSIENLKLTYRQCYCQYDIAIIGLELLSDG